MAASTEGLSPAPLDAPRSGASSMQSVLGSPILAALVAVFLFSAVFNLLLLATPLYITQVYSRVLLSKSVETLIVLSAAVIVAVAFAATFDAIRLSVLQRLSQRVFVILGEKVVRTSLSASTNVPNRELPLQDVDVIRRFIGGRGVLNMMDIPFSSLFIFIIFMIHPVIGIVATGMLVTMLVLAIVTDTLSSGGQRRVADSIHQSSADFSAFAGKGILLASMGMTSAVVVRWMQGQLSFAENLRRSESQTSVISGLSQIMRMTTQLVVIATGAFYAMNGHINPGMILACSILSSRAVQPIDGVIAGQRSFRGARDAYLRLKRLLSQSPQRVEIQHVPKSGAVEISELVYSVGRPQAILRGVNLSIEAGEIAAIVGPSGAGKSLVGQMLVGALTSTSGSVSVDGIDLKSSDINTRASSFGYLPQGSDTLPGTVAENIARFGSVNIEKVWEAVLLVKAEGEVSKLPQGLDTPMSRAATELSPGIYKRLLLARAFYNSPVLIVLDEPLSDLDVDGERMLADSIRVMRDKGATIILISPRGNLLAMVERVIVMRGGAVETVKNGGESAEAARGQLRPVGRGSNVRLLAE